MVESTHRNLKFTAPLTAITAAVVGVVINLALFFGYHLLWPEGFEGALDARSALIAIGAALMLFQYKRSVMQTIGLCALVGMAVKLIPL
jgi:chromate transporter